MTLDDAEARRRIGSVWRLVSMTPDEYAADYVARVVGRDAVAGLMVSTVWTEDHGFETALLDAAGTHPVERYPDRDAAGAGHAKWCWLAEALEEVVQLGLPEVDLPDRKITLTRGYRGR